MVTPCVFQWRSPWRDTSGVSLALAWACLPLFGWLSFRGEAEWHLEATPDEGAAVISTITPGLRLTWRGRFALINTGTVNQRESHGSFVARDICACDSLSTFTRLRRTLEADGQVARVQTYFSVLIKINEFSMAIVPIFRNVQWSPVNCPQFGNESVHQALISVSFSTNVTFHEWK